MPRRAPPITVESSGAPDPVAAASAILPLFLAFVEGRGIRPTTPRAAAPARVQDESRSTTT